MPSTAERLHCGLLTLDDIQYEDSKFNAAVSTLGCLWTSGGCHICVELVWCWWRTHRSTTHGRDLRHDTDQWLGPLPNRGRQYMLTLAEGA